MESLPRPGLPGPLLTEPRGRDASPGESVSVVLLSRTKVGSQDGVRKGGWDSSGVNVFGFDPGLRSLSGASLCVCVSVCDCV